MYDMPRVMPYNGPLPAELVSFNRARYDKAPAGKGVHFFIDDANFNCLWSSPGRYLGLLRGFGCVIGPDFSLYADMPLSQVLHNSFRNKLLTTCFQAHGIRVVPNVSWGAERTFAFCFDGLPQGSVVAVNSTGLGYDKRARYGWRMGYECMLERLAPSQILRYGAPQPGERADISVYYPNDNRKAAGHGR